MPRSVRYNPLHRSREERHMRVQKRLLVYVFAGLLCFSRAIPVAAQQGATEGQWTAYAGDLGATKYSPSTRSPRTT